MFTACDKVVINVNYRQICWALRKRKFLLAAIYNVRHVLVAKESCVNYVLTLSRRDYVGCPKLIINRRWIYLCVFSLSLSLSLSLYDCVGNFV